MPHTVIVLIGRVVSVNLIEAMPTSELLNLLFLHAESAHTFLALNAEVHFVSNEKTRTPTLIVDVRRLI